MVPRHPGPREPAREVVPDRAVEVVSTTNRTLDDTQKMEESYDRDGVRRVRGVMPNEARMDADESPSGVRIFSPVADLDGGATLPGFRMPLATLFGEGTA